MITNTPPPNNLFYIETYMSTISILEHICINIITELRCLNFALNERCITPEIQNLFGNISLVQEVFDFNDSAEVEHVAGNVARIRH